MCEGENASFCTLRGGGGRFQIDEQDIAQLFFLWQAGRRGGQIPHLSNSWRASPSPSWGGVGCTSRSIHRAHMLAGLSAHLQQPNGTLNFLGDWQVSANNAD